MAPIVKNISFMILHLSRLRRKKAASREESRRRRRNERLQLSMDRIERFRSQKRQERLVLFCYLTMLAAVLNSSSNNNRRFWSRNHPDQWWENAYRSYDDTQFIENFRMTRLTFVSSCNLLRADIEKQNTNMRSPISVERRVGVTLWVLGTNAEYRTVAALFGMGRSTVCCIVQEVVKALLKKKSSLIVFPSGKELDRVIDGYRAKWGFPNAGGAIDGSHIPILCPLKSNSDYHNRKGWYSIVIQAVVNDRYEFTDINVGWPGSVHDARVFVNSGIFQKGNNLFGDKHVEIGEAKVPVVLLGDPAYPLSNFVMKPYLDNGHLTAEQKYFNFKLSSSRMTVENSFGRLKARWRILQKRLDMNIDNIPDVITACVILNNMCEKAKDPIRVEWLEEVNRANQVLPQPRLNNNRRAEAERIGDSTQIRNIIRDHLAANR